ncbi:DeoR/GlpR family DNA-binding transcription regulator, partial [Streptococcus sp. DD13]|uniref:DeoR/GlpR family DNA-binding transcription regulator n=1 Tax=Streptococcus sp. DD13 TaxID=1777881 RepID=UPI0012E97603
MLKSERHNLILQLIQQQQFVHLDELITLLDSSESTVRRDLDELEAEGLLKRVHGGAEGRPRLQDEETISEKSVKNVQQKRAIAETAANMIQDQDLIFLDAGTSTGSIIPFLEGRQVTVVTNSIHHATRLVEINIPTMIVGGFVKQSTDASIGNFAL